MDILTVELTELLKEGWSAYQKKESTKALQDCVHEAIRRELSFNAEILSELGRTKESGNEEFPCWAGDERLRLIRALRTKAFDSLESHLMPLKVFFNEPVTESEHSDVFGIKDEREYPAHYARVRYIGTQAELLERTYHRLHFFKLYEEANGRKPSLTYMQYLVACALRSLRKT